VYTGSIPVVASGPIVMRRLLILRHAKSSWDDPGLADHDRPLAPRGRRAAKVIARHLSEEGIAPELVLCSSARRAQETLERVSAALDDPEVLVERRLYAASGDDLLTRVRAVPDDVRCVMLIGHNPAVERLTLGLAAPGAERDRAEAKFPTGALATLAFEGSWRALAPGGARLLAFVTPRELE
jgi:phosphohistidine phosphatase